MVQYVSYDPSLSSKSEVVDVEANLKLQSFNAGVHSLFYLYRGTGNDSSSNFTGFDMSTIEKLLLMLRDPDYRVRATVARQIGVLFQTRDGHNELLQDICFNFGAKLVYFSREEVATAKEVIAAGPQPRLFLETAIVTLLHLALETENIELVAVFMMYAVAAMNPCQRELVGAALDKLSMGLQYTARSKELFHNWLESAMNCALSRSRFRVSPLGKYVGELMVTDPTKYLEERYGVKVNVVSRTTIFAIKCDECIVFGADSRMTSTDYASVEEDDYLKIKCLYKSKYKRIFMLVSGDPYLAERIASEVSDLLKKERQTNRMVTKAAEFVTKAITKDAEQWMKTQAMKKKGTKKCDDYPYVGYIVGGACYAKDSAVGDQPEEFEIFHVFKNPNQDCQMVQEGRFAYDGSGSIYLRYFEDFTQDISETKAIELVFNGLRCGSRFDVATGGILRAVSVSRLRREEDKTRSLIPMGEPPYEPYVPYMSVHDNFFSAVPLN